MAGGITMAIDVTTLAVAKSYVKQYLTEAGALVGKNVVVSKIEPIPNGNKVTFSYTLDDGREQTSTMEVMNGKDGITPHIGENNHWYIGNTDTGIIASTTNDYNAMTNQPSINDIVLSGNKTFNDLGLDPLTNTEILEIISKASN